MNASNVRVSDMENLIRYPVRLQASNQHGRALKTLKSKAYFHLGMDGRGSLHLYVNIHIGESFTRVTIAKSYVMDALLHSLLVRPIRASATPFTWYHKELNNLKMYPIENVSPELVEEYYTLAQSELLDVCEKKISDDQRRLCKAQIQKLLSRQEAVSNSILALDSISMARAVGASL